MNGEQGNSSEDFNDYDYGNNDPRYRQEYHSEGSGNRGYPNNYPYNQESAGRYGGYPDGQESSGSGNNDDRYRYLSGQRERNQTEYGGKLRRRIFTRKVIEYKYNHLIT